MAIICDRCYRDVNADGLCPECAAHVAISALPYAEQKRLAKEANQHVKETREQWEAEATAKAMEASRKWHEEHDNDPPKPKWTPPVEADRYILPAKESTKPPRNIPLQLRFVGGTPGVASSKISNPLIIDESERYKFWEDIDVINAVLQGLDIDGMILQVPIGELRMDADLPDDCPGKSMHTQIVNMEAPSAGSRQRKDYPQRVDFYTRSCAVRGRIEDTTHGSIRYWRDSSIGSARVIFWRGGQMYDVSLIRNGNELSVYSLHTAGEQARRYPLLIVDYVKPD